MRYLKLLFVAFTVSLVIGTISTNALDNTVATDYMLSSGISAGVAPGDYGATLPVTWGQAVKLASRALTPDNAIVRESLVWADRYSCYHRSNDLVTWEDMCNIAVYIPNPIGQYPIGTAPLEYWKETGLVPQGATSEDTITRGDVASIFYSIMNTTYSIPDCSVEIIIEDNYLFYPLQVVPFIAAIENVPDEILDSFTASNWTFTIGRQAAIEYSEKYNNSFPLGVTNYATDNIAVTTAGPVEHEFGHYFDMALQFPEIHNSLYLAESGNLAKATGQHYCATSRYEYFAECFSWYVTGQYLDIMQEVAPRTYDYMTNLMEGYYE